MSETGRPLHHLNGPAPTPFGWLFATTHPNRPIAKIEITKTGAAAAGGGRVYLLERVLGTELVDLVMNLVENPNFVVVNTVVQHRLVPSANTSERTVSLARS